MKRLRVLIGLTAILALLVVVQLPVESAVASRGCGSIEGSGQFAATRTTVIVKRGPISCRTARLVAEELFSNRSVYHNCGYSYCSYWTVTIHGRRWRGGISTGLWLMHRCRVAAGCGRVVGGRISF
jgi:hypothetical protein